MPSFFAALADTFLAVSWQQMSLYHKCLGDCNSVRLVAAFYRDSQLLLVVLLLRLVALLRVQQQALLQAKQAKG